MKVFCFCDGACSNNGKESASAGIAYWLRGEVKGGKEKKKAERIVEDIWRPTSQRAELMAAIEALRQLTRKADIQVVSDSKYLIETMKGNMRRNTNLDLWKELDILNNTHKIQWSWLPRNSVPELAWCDRFASAKSKETFDELHNNS
jgi:ribonuclease HI